MLNDDIDQSSPGTEFARDVIQNWMERQQGNRRANNSF